MKKLQITLSIILCIFTQVLTAQSDSIPQRVYTTTFVENAMTPIIDGLLNDESWHLVEWSGDYIEWSPAENTPPTEQTKMKILYGEKDLFVAFRCYDKDPDGIVKRMSRRDGFDGEWVEINIDSYHDLRTAFSFTISVSGVKGEEFVTDNGNNWDVTWNPIWYAKTNIDDEGWTAEIRIPLSQLRFNNDKNQVWGIQSTRRYFRNEERSVWQRKPQNVPGWVSNFGELRGLKNLQPQKQIEIQPYVVSSLKTYEPEASNPFRDGSDFTLNAGIDGKIGITNDLTLDFTINPDFGQVEADPSQIALDGFQIFFQEQRPFFIENKNIFDYKFSRSQAGNTFGFDNLFYSRRIGRAPQGYPNIVENDFVDQPNVSRILGAAKFSGKTKNGWSIGILESITNNEKATISNEGEEHTEIVEPLTNYFVGRLQKDFNHQNTYVGGIFTATNRKLTENLDFLHESAFSGGLDFKHQWNNRSWYLGGDVVFSQVNGSETAITNTQKSIRHLFQREDASHLSVNETKTSLTGTGGNMQIGKVSGNWRFETGATWRSPELELNDVGFQRQADDFRQYTWVGYRSTKALKNLRAYGLNFTHVQAFDFEQNLNEVNLNTNAWLHLKNNWRIFGGINYKPVNFSTSRLRGGPRFKNANSFSYNNGINSDGRKKLRVNLNHFGIWGKDKAYRFQEVNLRLTYQPTNALQVSISPSYSINHDKLQYVTTTDFNTKNRYIGGEINQKTFRIPLRIDYIITPNFSIQYWGQPFISIGKYSNFKTISNPTANHFSDRFTTIKDSQINLNDNIYSIDENEDGLTDYEFYQPDFSFVQWRSNLVLRWEYIPGSELFLVWSQDISTFGDTNDELLQGLENEILQTKPESIFLLKGTYRFIR